MNGKSFKVHSVFVMNRNIVFHSYIYHILTFINKTIYKFRRNLNAVPQHTTQPQLV